jgi:hypothetical protein
MSFLGKTLYQFAGEGAANAGKRFSARPASPMRTRGPAIKNKEVPQEVLPQTVGPSALRFAKESDPDLPIPLNFSRRDIKPVRFQKEEPFGSPLRFQPKYGNTGALTPGFKTNENVNNFGRSKISFENSRSYTPNPQDGSSFSFPGLGSPKQVSPKQNLFGSKEVAPRFYNKEDFTGTVHRDSASSFQAPSLASPKEAASPKYRSKEPLAVTDPQFQVP